MWPWTPKHHEKSEKKSRYKCRRIAANRNKMQVDDSLLLVEEGRNRRWIPNKSELITKNPWESCKNCHIDRGYRPFSIFLSNDANRALSTYSLHALNCSRVIDCNCLNSFYSVSSSSSSFFFSVSNFWKWLPCFTLSTTEWCNYLNCAGQKWTTIERSNGFKSGSIPEELQQIS